VNYSRRSTKDTDLQSIFSTTLRKDKAAVRCTKAWKKKTYSNPH